MKISLKPLSKNRGPLLAASMDTRHSLRDYLIRGAGGSFALKLVATALGFILSIVLARLLGAAGYGTYAYAMALVSLLSVPAKLGLPSLIIRHIAAYQRRSVWALMRGLLLKANQAVLLIAWGLVLLAAVIGWVLADRLPPDGLATFWLALVLLPLVALNALRTATLSGLGYVLLGQLPEALIKPGLFILLAGGSYLLLGAGQVTAVWAMGMQVAASAVAFLVGVVWLVKRLPQAVKETAPAYKTRAWIKSALPLLALASLAAINHETAILMVGAMKGAEAAGVYQVATRGAELVSFVLVAANMALAPVISSLYTAGELQRLQRIVTRSARVVLLGSLPVALSMVIFGRWILLTVFGPDFVSGATALAILSAAQIINAGIGSVGLLLVMTGHERDTATGVGIAAAINVTLNALLIPVWGIEGAAIATAISVATWNVLLAVWVYRRLGIYTTAAGSLGLRSSP